MKIETFQMERMQSIWENRVRYNLSESGVHALQVSELECGDLDEVRLGYTQTNGSVAAICSVQKLCWHFVQNS